MMAFRQTAVGLVPLLVCLALAATGESASLPTGVTAATFRNPPNRYRLVQYQLTRGALKEYPEYGIGGFMGFFYKNLYKQGPRGPRTIGPVVDAAYKSRRTVWLADDWGYPSGMAGGRVVAENADFEVKSLVMLTRKGNGPGPIAFSLPDDLHDIVHAALYPVKGSGVDVAAAKPVKAGKRELSARGLQGGWELRVFARFVRSKNMQAQSTMQQFGHTGRYPDVMNREAISRFIANMHAPILAQIRNPSRTVEGFYCNEPNLMQTHWVGGKSPYACAPWSDELPTLFKKMHGYSLFSVLPHLFEGKSAPARRARIHYRQAVAELFTDSFAKQIRTWCKKRGIKSSGHYLLNAYLVQHVQGYGDLMKFVSEFDVPALDIPIPNPNQFMKFNYQMSRFFSSVTAWKDREATLMLLDPIIGGYGMNRLSPDMPLLINSVNMASFHGINIFTSYLPRKPGKGAKGYAKEEYRFLNEYSGRLTQVLRGADREAQVALYYPIAMFQADLLASGEHWTAINSRHNTRQQAWDRTEGALLTGDIEYLIVHPEGVAEAKIENGRMKIGAASYRTLVMPQLEFLPLAVARQLERFEKAGGRVIWVDRVPGGAEHAGNDSAVKAALRNAKTTPSNGLAESIPASFSSSFDLSFTPGTDRMLVGRFNRKGKRIYLLVNRLQEAISATVTRKTGRGSVTVLDPSTGRIKSARLPAELSLEPTRALLLIP